MNLPRPECPKWEMFVLERVGSLGMKVFTYPHAPSPQLACLGPDVRQLEAPTGDTCWAHLAGGGGEGGAAPPQQPMGGRGGRRRAESAGRPGAGRRGRWEARKALAST